MKLKAIRSVLLAGLSLGFASAVAATDWHPLEGTLWQSQQCGRAQFVTRVSSEPFSADQRLRLVVANTTMNDIEFSVAPFHVVFADRSTALALGLRRAIRAGSETSLSHFWFWRKETGIVGLEDVRIRCGPGDADSASVPGRRRYTSEPTG